MARDGLSPEDLVVRQLQGWTKMRGHEYWKRTDDRGETLGACIRK